MTVLNVVADCIPKDLSLPSLPVTSSAWTQIPPPFIDYGGNQSGTYQILDTPSPFLPPINFEPPQLCDCTPEDYEPKCLEIPIQSSVLNAGLEAVAAAVKKIPRVELEDPEADVKVKVCTCCDEDGVGLTVQGGAGVKFKGKVSFGPDLGFKSTNTAFGFVVESDIVLRCAVDFPFEINASVDGQTTCHFKDLEVSGRMSLDLPFALRCEAGAKYTLMKDGTKLGEQFATTSVNIEYGFSGAFEYHRDSKGSRTEGEICGKGLTFRVPLDVDIAGVRFSIGITNELFAGNCLQFGGGSALALAVIEAADQSFQQAVHEQKRIAKVARMPSTTRVIEQANVSKASTDSAGEGGLCAKVKLRLDQDLVMARQAFNATLELENNSPGGNLTNIAVAVFVVDESGKDVSERFGVRPPALSGISAVNGTGQIGPNSSGTASWILVPTSEASPVKPTRYGVGGVLTYWQDGNEVTTPLFPAPITVYPDPRLSVKYFHQRDVFGDDPFTRDIVEPGMPFNLAVLVQNNGRGSARDVRIVSGQPRIVENEKGLLIDFQIIGTEVSGRSQPPSLTAAFGEIPPGTNAIGRWLMTSTLQGLFTEYKATFEHKDSLGKTNLSLIDDVSIHEMIHLVRAPGSLDDGRPDFLVNDVRDSEDLPDTIYLSDGRTNGVEVVRRATTDAPPNTGDLTVELSAAMPGGWAYLRVPDPANGRFQLARVLRSDGHEVSPGTNVWTTDRTFIGQSQRPRYENTLHLLDYESTGRYTLIYAPLPPTDAAAPTSIVEVLPGSSYPQFSLKWDGEDGQGSGVASFDIFVSEDDGPFIPWLQNTPLRSSIYQGSTGNRYAFYSVAVDQGGNREAAPGGPDAQTIISRINTAPTMDLPAIVEVDEGQPIHLTIAARDPDSDQTLSFALGAGAPAGLLLNPRSGEITWPTDEGNGPSTNRLRLIVSDNGQPPLSTTGVVSVVVREVNQSPILSALSNRKVNELQTLALTMNATDPDLPAQKLTYTFAPGAPAGARLDAATGVFTWTPTVLQGPSTNRIGIIVRDNGEPSLSATQTFNVIVRDTRADFTVSLGSANLLAGETGSLPIQLLSGLDLTNISFSLNLSSAGLQNLAVAPSSLTVSSTTLSPAGVNRFELRLSATSGDVLESASELARLKFTTDTNHPSALVYLTPTGILGVRSSGEVATHGGGTAGRVIVVNREPVLLAEPGEPRALTLYGQPGASFALERTPAFGSANWQTVLRHPQTTIADRIEVGGEDTPVFYRALRFQANPAMLVPTRDGEFILFGEPGKTYLIESAPSVGPLSVWNAVPSLSLRLVNSWQIVTPAAGRGSDGYFRAVFR
ncbi:MAG: cadherin repeat domain-containing protein [Pedosphaera sp.]|nr:cadherin repeat domain-containing protein [Pedosphaera sp.]